MSVLRNILIIASSTFQPPGHLRCIIVPDLRPIRDLVAVFSGQDVIVNFISTLSVTVQYRIINAAITAGAAAGDTEWMVIACGMWRKWKMEHDFVGMHVREERFVFYDFTIKQKQLLAAIERIYDVVAKEKQGAVRNSDHFATFALVETRFAMGRFDGRLENKPSEILNEKLELSKYSLEEVVTDGLKATVII
ncbi:NmrA-like family protein [Annulohypoxylon moriforme]|nr:NmrA-like family protein [Annulohypoxylon moriforme]